MKKYTICLILIFVFSCKEKTPKNETNKEVFEIIEEDESSSIYVGEEVPLIPMEMWNKRGTELLKTEEIYRKNQVFNLSIKKDAQNYAVVIIPKIKLNYSGGKYKLSFIVKQGSTDSQLGVRIGGVPPQKTDFIFDLGKGEVLQNSENNELTNNLTTNIFTLESNLYHCSITADINSSVINLYFGPTTIKRRVKSWESLRDGNKDINLYILPESITVEEVE